MVIIDIVTPNSVNLDVKEYFDFIKVCDEYLAEDNEELINACGVSSVSYYDKFVDKFDIIADQLDELSKALRE